MTHMRWEDKLLNEKSASAPNAGCSVKLEAGNLNVMALARNHANGVSTDKAISSIRESAWEVASAVVYA